MADQLSLDEVVRFTSDLIRIDTTNRGSGEGNERPAAEYVAERLAEAGIEPLLLESAPGRANVVARIAGSGPDRDALLVHGHLDVVPADPADWSVDPFSGEVDGDTVWGRGAIDMKDMDAMVLSVVRSWAREGRRPRRDLVLAFTADEEDTASYGSQWLVTRHPELFEGCTEGISESGGFSFHAGPDLRLYPIASGERGTAWMRLTARGKAGHGSKANPRNAVAMLAAAITRIDAYQWPVRLIPTVKAALAGIADALGIEADLDDPELDINALLSKFGPAAALVESTLRNSANPTMLEAGYKVNVIPGEATGHVDGRVLAGHLEEFERTIDELVGDEVTWEYFHHEIPLEAPHDSPAVAAMRDALLAEDPEGRPVPYCMSGGTDAKQFSRLGIAGYGFTPLFLPPEYDYYQMFHGVDERVPVRALRFGVRVLDRFLANVG